MRNPSTSSAPAAAAARASTSKTPCCSKVGIKRGPWMPEEDQILSGYINKEGEGRWRTLPKRAGLQRCGKSCRLRWMNYLRPSVKRGRITPDEEDLILRLHRLLGNRWSLIAGRIPGRTDNEIKNYWNTHLSKKLISQGIDPRNHKPLNPSPPNTSSGQLAPCDQNPPSISNPNPKNSQELQEASSSHNLTIVNIPNPSNPNHEYQYDQAHAAMGGHNNEVDTFSSFLDSLINESALVTHHHQTQLPIVSSAHQDVHAFDHGSFWDAELIRSTMEALGDMQNDSNTTHHQGT